MKPRILLILVINTFISLIFVTNINAGIMDWFSQSDANTSSLSKQDNLNTLLKQMDIDSQTSQQVELILKMTEQPLIELMRTIKKDIPQGEQASKILHKNYDEFKQSIIDSIDYKKIYYDIYDQYYTNNEISELIKIFDTDVGKKFLKNNLEINKKIFLTIQPKIIEALLNELPKMNNKILSDFIDSDYIDKVIDIFKSKLKQDLKQYLQ